MAPRRSCPTNPVAPRSFRLGILLTGRNPSPQKKYIGALHGLKAPAGPEVQSPSIQDEPVLISSNQEMEADSCQAASSTSAPSLPQGITYWDPYLGSVAHRTSDGLIKAKTTVGPQGFLVGAFEGFKAQPFVTEVPNLALDKTKTNIKQVELPLGQEKEQNKTTQKGQVLKDNGPKKRNHKGQGQEEKGQRKRQQ